MEQSFIAYIENSIKNNWDLDALTDYKGATLQYKDVACLLYTSPSPRDKRQSRMPSSA